jgi:chromosome segregation ATPase
VGNVGGLRVALAAILTLGLMASGATSVSANDSQNNEEEVIPPGPGLADLKQAIDDFRVALADLRQACQAERDAAVSEVTTARKRQPKVETECQKTLKQLKSEYQSIREQAKALESKYVADTKQQRIDAAKQKEADAKAKLEQAQKEEQARQEQAKKDAQKAVQTPKPAQSPTDQVAKKRAQLLEQLKQVDATLVYKQGLFKQSTDAAAEYRAKAATLTGADRDRYLAKAVQADKDAAQWAGYVRDYTAQHDQLVAQLAQLGTTVAPLPMPKPEDTASKRAKLEQMLSDLNDKVTYKWSESDRYAAMATDFRAQAAAATSPAMRDLFNAKATDADHQADDWANLARQYEDQRDDVQHQLDALSKP